MSSKISNLPAIVGADLATGDLAVVVDTSAGTDNKITVGEFAEAMGLLLPRLPGFGTYTATGVVSNGTASPTYYTPGSASFDADQTSGIYVARRTHHSANETTFGLYSATTDQPVGKVFNALVAGAGTLADGRSALTGQVAYVESSDGSNYIDLELSANLKASGEAATMQGFIYIDCAEYPAGGFTRLGIYNNEWMVRGRLLAGQTSAPLRFEVATTGATLFQVAADGSITATGVLAMGTHKITGLSNGSSSDDAAAFGQIASAVSAAVSDTAYNSVSWDAVTTVAPSKNAVRDKIEVLAPLASPTFTGTPAAPTAAAATNTTQLATTAFVEGELGLHAAAPAVSTRWYRRSYGVSAAAAATSTLNKMYASRVLLQAGTLVRIAGQHFGSATASELMRLGIYADSAGRPGALIVDAGTIDLSTATAFKSITISQAIATGWYWLAGTRQGPTNTATMIAFGNDNQRPGGMTPWQEFDGTNIHNGTYSIATITSISGALPNPFGTATMQADDGFAPIVAVRY